jgi:membrane protein implicated in regulation of membrane protease activity
MWHDLLLASTGVVIAVALVAAGFTNLLNGHVLLALVLFTLAVALDAYLLRYTWLVVKGRRKH